MAKPWEGPLDLQISRPALPLNLVASQLAVDASARVFLICSGVLDLEGSIA
jgi:hypothetical protein